MERRPVHVHRTGVRKCDTSTSSRGSRVRAHDSVFLPRWLTHTTLRPRRWRTTRSIFSWKCPATRYAAKKRGKRKSRKRGRQGSQKEKNEKNKKKEARKIKVGSHERLTRRGPCTRGARDVYGVTEKRKEERTSEAKGKKIEKKTAFRRLRKGCEDGGERTTFIGCSFSK